MAEAQQFLEMLQALQSGDNNVRTQAEKAYENMKDPKTGSPDQVLKMLVNLTCEKSLDEGMRKIAAVLLRRGLDCEAKKDTDFMWPNCTPATKAETKQKLLQCMLETDTNLCKTVGNAVATLACFICDTDNAGQGFEDWPDLLPALFKLWGMPSAKQRETGINTLAQLCLPMKQQLLSAEAQQAIGQHLQKGLNPETETDPMVRASTVNLICEMVEAFDKNEWQPLQPVLPLMLACVQSCLRDENALKCCLEALVSTADEEPNFFKPQMKEYLTFFQALAKERQLDETQRVIALEWMVAVAEAKKKTLVKWVPDAMQMILDTCMTMMLEVDEDLDEWKERLYDEEGDDDDSAFAAGEQNIDHFVDALGIDLTCQALFACIGKYSQMNEWQAKHAAMVAIKQTVEYIDEEHTQEFAKLALSHLQHPHARVRHAALEAIGQLAIDQVPHFQEQMHEPVIKALMQAFDDPEDRVAAMALSAFVNFGDEVDDTVMMDICEPLMAKLIQKLHSNHRGVKQETLTCIAVIASCLEEEFSKYYDGIMPIVKAAVVNCKDDKERMLRGKAFECMSLLGLAVGKKKFAPDVAEAMNEMAALPLKADDVQKDYIKEAMERIAKTLKEDFAVYLAALLPGILTELALPVATVESNAIADTDDEDEEEDMLSVRTQDGKKVSIKSSRFTDMKNAIELLLAIVQETGPAFGPYVQQTATALVPLLETKDQMSYLCHELRSEAFSVWGELVKTVGKTNPQQTKELLNMFISKVLAGAAQEDDAETITEVARGLQKVLENCPAGVVDDAVVSQVKDFLQMKMQEAFQRRDQLGEQEDSDDEDAKYDEDIKDEREDEDTRRIALAAVYGALMKSNPDSFIAQIGQQSAMMVQTWLCSKEPHDRVLGFNLVADWLEHMAHRESDLQGLLNHNCGGETVLQKLMNSLSDKESEVRVAANFATNLAFRTKAFINAHDGQVAKHALTTLTNVVHKSPKPKNKDTNAKLAFDNAVAALVMGCIHAPQLCDNLNDVWELIFTRLPLRFDEDESQKLNDYLFEKVSTGDKNTIGANHERLGKFLGLFGDVYSTELISDDLKEKIKVFMCSQQIQQQLQSLGSQFTDKQIKKVKKIMAAAASQ